MWHSTFQHFVSGFIYHTPQQIYNSVFQWIFACQLSFLQHDTHTWGCQTLVSPWFTPTDLRLTHTTLSPLWPTQLAKQSKRNKLKQLEKRQDFAKDSPFPRHSNSRRDTNKETFVLKSYEKAFKFFITCFKIFRHLNPPQKVSPIWLHWKFKI